MWLWNFSFVVFVVKCFINFSSAGLSYKRLIYSIITNIQSLTMIYHGIYVIFKQYFTPITMEPSPVFPMTQYKWAWDSFYYPEMIFPWEFWYNVETDQTQIANQCIFLPPTKISSNQALRSGSNRLVLYHEANRWKFLLWKIHTMSSCVNAHVNLRTYVNIESWWIRYHNEPSNIGPNYFKGYPKSSFVWLGQWT